MRKKQVAVLISGDGSNLQALIDAAKANDYPATIALVISNKEGVGGLARAQKAGVATAVISHKEYETRPQFEAAIHKTLEEAGIELICLAGFMRILNDHFVRVWEGKMLNIHPSLLPKYRGLNTHARAIKAGDKKAGCTVHWVVPELDAGPIIDQASVEVLVDDTPEVLATRVKLQEHEIYPKALLKAALGLA
ncbi:MAG: phosphoribosylglycinamide formyltransferase [Rickettsiales bacterium]|nr:phosphoribosylglycinamide formyltransferase [Rickettsiales bacterium]